MSLHIQVELPSGCRSISNRRVEIIAQEDVATVEDLQRKIIERFNLRNQTYYLFWHSDDEDDDFPFNWLPANAFLSKLPFSDSTVLKMYTRFNLLSISLAMGSKRYQQYITTDITVPLSKVYPFIARRFQLKDFREYGLFYDSELLDDSKSLVQLDIGPQEDFLFSLKSATIEAEVQTKSVEKQGVLYRYNAKKKRFDRFIGHLWNNNLLLYKDDISPENHVDSIDLKMCNIEIQQKKKDVFFELKSLDPNDEPICFKCDMSEEIDEWVNTLKPLCLCNKPVQRNKKLIFGGSLQDALKPDQDIPDIITKTVEYVKEKALDVEGIFRLSGGAVKIESYVAIFNKGGDVDLNQEEDPHTVAGLLKQYLRDMAIPLIPYEFYDTFISAQMTQDKSERYKLLKIAIGLIPEQNKKVLKYLFEFIAIVDSHSAQNKMAIHNLGTVFGPNLLKLKDGDPLAMVQDTPYINGLVQSFVEGYDIIFSEDEVTAVPVEALYDYEKQGSDDISLKKGDELKVTSQSDPNWWSGENLRSGEMGRFPANYVKVVPPNVNKRRQFMNKLNAKKRKLEECERGLIELETKYNNLQKDIEILESQGEPEVEKRQIIENIITSVPNFANVKRQLEGYYKRVQTQNTYRTALEAKKQEFTLALRELKQSITNDKKLNKKYKDKNVFIEGVLDAFETEQKTRTVADYKNERMLKSVAQFMKILS